MSAQSGSAQAGSAQAGSGRGLGLRFRATAGSEWIKFRSLRSGPASLLAAAVLVLLGAWLLTWGYRSDWGRMSAADRTSFDPVYTSLRGIELAQLLVGALGVTTVTGEYTSGLVRGTFVATPQRVQVLAVQAAVFTAVVWTWCTALSFAALLLGQGLLTGPVPHVGLGDPGVLTAAFGGGLYLTLVGLFGLFTGLLVRRTPAALAVLFGILTVAPLIASMLPGRLGANLAEFMPGSAGEQAWKLVHTGPYTLGPWQGLGVLAACVATTAAAGLVLLRRRDV
jgi:ABC-2 type transport system permease protein